LVLSFELEIGGAGKLTAAFSLLENLETNLEISQATPRQAIYIMVKSLGQATMAADNY
jgi:hypothetical protein